ncbi:MAG: HAD family hydrolase, partial [Marinilabiliales bacterium]|nr:HAD family hydrolase [Marinilabiliales bacterium]
LATYCYKLNRRLQTESTAPKDLILVGLVGMIDPPRAEVKDSILKAKSAGVKTLMITGDHKNTAFAIAFQLGIAEKIEQTITGQEIDRAYRRGIRRTD